eukprot:1744873-Amphidinium_carterae.1
MCLAQSAYFCGMVGIVCKSPTCPKLNRERHNSGSPFSRFCMAQPRWMKPGFPSQVAETEATPQGGAQQAGPAAPDGVS